MTAFLLFSETNRLIFESCDDQFRQLLLQKQIYFADELAPDGLDSSGSQVSDSLDLHFVSHIFLPMVMLYRVTTLSENEDISFISRDGFVLCFLEFREILYLCCSLESRSESYWRSILLQVVQLVQFSFGTFNLTENDQIYESQSTVLLSLLQCVRHQQKKHLAISTISGSNQLNLIDFSNHSILGRLDSAALCQQLYDQISMNHIDIRAIVVITNGHNKYHSVSYKHPGSQLSAGDIKLLMDCSRRTKGSDFICFVQESDSDVGIIRIPIGCYKQYAGEGVQLLVVSELPNASALRSCVKWQKYNELVRTCQIPKSRNLYHKLATDLTEQIEVCAEVYGANAENLRILIEGISKPDRSSSNQIESYFKRFFGYFFTKVSTQFATIEVGHLSGCLNRLFNSPCWIDKLQLRLLHNVATARPPTPVSLDLDMTGYLFIDTREHLFLKFNTPDQSEDLAVVLTRSMNDDLLAVGSNNSSDSDGIVMIMVPKSVDSVSTEKLTAVSKTFRLCDWLINGNCGSKRNEPTQKVIAIGFFPANMHRELALKQTEILISKLVRIVRP